MTVDLNQVVSGKFYNTISTKLHQGRPGWTELKFYKPPLTAAVFTTQLGFLN